MQVGLLGYGYWGKKIFSKLKKLTNVEIAWVYTSQDKWWVDTIDLDWVFIATPNDTHFKQVKYFLKQGINVLCEKPLTPTYEQSKELFNLAEKYNVKLYVDDVFNFRTEKLDTNIFQQNDIEVIWNKKSTNTSYDLYYHDLYLLYPIIKNNQSILNNIKFKYGQSNNKTHKINNINFTHTENSNDALLDMISCVLEGKVDYDYNKEISLFCNLIIDKKNEKNGLYNGTPKT